MGGIGSGVRPGTVDPVLEIDDTALEFFRTCGIKKFGYAMVASSLRDIIALQDDPHAPDEVVESARWLGSDGGREFLAFLVPGASADALIGRVQEDPGCILQAFDSALDEINREARACEQICAEQAAEAGKSGATPHEQIILVQRELVEKHSSRMRQLELDLFDSVAGDAMSQSQPAPQAAWA